MDGVDVLVVGAGAAGMTAALVARAKGMSVLIVEASDAVGGTTSTSAGTLWLPCVDDGRFQADARCEEQARAYLRACIGPCADDAKIDALIRTGAPLLRFLDDRTAVRLDAVPTHPDYLQSLPGATMGGRAFAPRAFDGRTLGAAFGRVRPPLPEFMVLGGMMVSKADIPMLLRATREPKAFVHAAKLLARYAMDRLRGRRGTRLVMGNALVGQLLKSVLRAGIPIRFESPVTSVRRERHGFHCTLGSAGSQETLHVRKAVVLATGGFSGNAGQREAWLPPAARRHSVAYRGNAGAGIELGRSLGGGVETTHAQPAFWMPVSTMTRRDKTTAVFPHIVLDRAKPGSLAVDGRGRRFVNEADAYHHFCEAMLRRSEQHPGDRFFLIADRHFVRAYGLGLIRPGGKTHRFERAGYLVTAGSAGELAHQLGLPADTLAATLQQFNENAAQGHDPDFARGTSPLNRHNGDPSHPAHPCLAPLDVASLCAVELHVADLATSVGLATDEHARVLDAGGRPIPGVYACGNDMASMMRGSYPGPGTTLGPGMVFAYRAMTHLAQEPGC